MLTRSAARAAYNLALAMGLAWAIAAGSALQGRGSCLPPQPSEVETTLLTLAVQGAGLVAIFALANLAFSGLWRYGRRSERLRRLFLPGAMAAALLAPSAWPAFLLLGPCR